MIFKQNIVGEASRAWQPLASDAENVLVTGNPPTQ